MKKFYAVIDTNVIISALLTDKADVATVRIINAVADGKIQAVAHDEILDEYRRVLSYKKFNFSKTHVNSVIQFFKRKSIFLGRTHSDEEFPDPKDIVLYEVTLTAREKFDGSYLVTGNGRHFPAKPFVVSPAEMIRIVEEGS